jgi:2,3-bisphosphoglycerate-dependent phosphoglycerate mutase
MELLLIRHALPERVELESGAADPVLSDVGQSQAKHLAEYLMDERLDAIYASPLRRAVQTAQPLADARGYELRIVADVAEWDRNSSEYVPVEVLKATNDPRWQAILSGEWSASIEETAEQFAARSIAAIEELVGAHGGQRIAIVCHGGVINAYLAHVLGVPHGAPFFYPNYTSIHRVAAARSGERSIVTVNETSHLRRTGLPMGLFQEG